MKRVLVTGGAGFLGSHLVRRLLGEGCHVTVIDNFQTGSMENLEDVADHVNLRVLEHDVIEAFDIPVDRVYQLACPASPPRYQRDPIHTTMTSVSGTLNALRLAEKHRARFLQASTSEVYGEPELHPQQEDYRGNVNPVGPRACYDEGKRCAESLVMDYHRTCGLDVRIARIFNTYGPSMDLYDGRVVSNFVRQALDEEPLTVYGDGSQTRSLCYVDDLIEGLVGLMERFDGPEPVNLGNPEEYTVLEIAREVIRQVGQGRVVHRPLPVDDPTHRRPDIARAQDSFGFRPTVSFAEGLARTIPDFARRRQACASQSPEPLLAAGK